jgi:uncharacterized protein
LENRISDSIPLHYLSIAQRGKNQWWRYVCGISFSLFSFIIVGGLVYGIILALALGNVHKIEEFGKVKSLGNFITSNIPAVFLFLGTILAVQKIHYRSAWGLVNGSGTINWRRFSYGFAIWFGIIITHSLLSLWIEPGEYKFHFDIAEWPLLFVATMILTPIQTSGEEFNCPQSTDFNY